jgi:hypothetical protein
VAGEYARGGLAIAPHVQGEIAGSYFAKSGFFRLATILAEQSHWFLLPTLLPALQGLWRWRNNRQKQKSNSAW